MTLDDNRESHAMGCSFIVCLVLGPGIGLYKNPRMSNLQNQECDMDLTCLSFSITPLNFFNILMFHVFHKHEVFMKAFIVADLLSG